MDSLGSFFKVENDVFYKYGEKKGETKGEKRGEKKGEKKKTDIVVANLLSELKITDEQAARIADVPVSYIRKMRRALKKKQA
jgi:predicted transposase YdaD